MEIRDKVLKKLEEARQAKDIAASLEAKIIVSFPNSLISLLRGSEDMLREAFIVSQVELKEGKKMEVEVERAKGRKCERCWNYSPYVGKNEDHPALCERCWKVISSKG